MLFEFPSPILYWEELPEHNSIKEELFEDIMFDSEGNGESYRRKLGWNCDVTSSYFRDNPLEFITQDHFDTIVWRPLNRFLEEVPERQRLFIPQLELIQFWYNTYEAGQYQEVHDHNGQNSIFSGIYILDMSADQENTTSFVHSAPRWCGSGGTYGHATKEIGEGTVMLFPSDLQHYVNPAKGNRTTISFNIGAKL